MEAIMRIAACAVLVGLLLGSAALATEDIETRAKRLEGRLMSPCCMSNTVAVHESVASTRMRAEIRTMLAEGRNEQEILDFYVERHGEQILAMPRAKGFSLTAYLFPLVFFVAAGAGLAVVFRRWRKTDRPEEPAAPAPTGPYAERLQRELENFD
jgi:cytochrome c-type biogenesis protein CcmH